MKTCPRCGGERPEAKGWCDSCRSKYMKEYRKENPEQIQALNRSNYEKNKDSMKVAASEHHRLRGPAIIIRNTKIVNAAKNVPCADCGQRWPPEAMDFDHVRGKKLADLSRMSKTRYSVSKILEEIAKCEVVCACCHRIRTNRRRLSQSPSYGATGNEPGFDQDRPPAGSGVEIRLPSLPENQNPCSVSQST